MDPLSPTVSTLYNYDTDHDASPGLVIAKGGSGPDESDPTKYQAWRTPVFSQAVTIQGDATAKLWSAMKDFKTGLGGVVTLYLRDCAGWDCVEVASDTFADANWHGGSGSWAQKTISVPIGTYTLPPGHSLELVVVVDGSSDDDMWFAYDTGPYRSRLVVNASSADVLTMGAVPGGWLTRSWARLLFA
jgi:hypothetical protein